MWHPRLDYRPSLTIRSSAPGIFASEAVLLIFSAPTAGIWGYYWGYFKAYDLKNGMIARSCRLNVSPTSAPEKFNNQAGLEKINATLLINKQFCCRSSA
jgi:hypothetical protein